MKLGHGQNARKLVIAFGIVATGFVSSCRKDEDSFEIVTLEGKVEAIERESEREGTVTVIYYSEKHKQEIAGTGRVTQTTEIMINGAAATNWHFYE